MNILLWSIAFVFILNRPSLVCADELQLNEGWTITNLNSSIWLRNQVLPSGVYSALEDANITESVLYSFNDVALRWIAHDTWTYTLDFNVAESYSGFLKCALVFHGLDTVANIQLNGRVLGPPFAQNMFVRYSYDVCDLLNFTSPNSLSVQFVPPALAAKLEASKHPTTPPECPPKPYNGECHMNFLRKMQASFSWDWGLAAPSVGIWKPVTLEIYQSAIIRDVTYRLEEDIGDNTWLVAVTVYLDTSDAVVKGYLSMELVGLSSLKWVVECKRIQTAECVQTQMFRVPRDSVDIWWPNGLGTQPLYDLNVFWEGVVPAESGSSAKTIRIGFRTIELVEEPARNNGLSFYLRVNHVPVFMKGSNWIPSHILPERANNLNTIKRLLADVRDAHMNMLRVWGGGIYESDEFYAMADEMGILIWQDMMFACAMYPAHPSFLKSVATEIRQNVRRIQSHPSIALWAGNNENEVALRSNWYGTSTEMQRFSSEYIQLYDATIRRVVGENDQWHVWLYSSPSNGNIRANQSIIQDDPQDSNFGDIHYYNYVLDGWNPNIYPHPRFASEYGFQSFPSLNAWRSVLSKTDNFTQLLGHRQHFPFASIPVMLLINRHLPLPPLSSRRYDAALVYFSQLSQAMTTRAESEVYRIKRGSDAYTMGALYWQLNDVWVAPSWSSIEYNGNFKILHHWAREFFAPLTVVAHVNEISQVEVYVINDRLEDPGPLQVRMDVFKWSSLDSLFSSTINVSMSANSVQMVNNFHIDTHIKPPLTRANSVLRFQLLSSNGTVVSSSHVFPVSLKNAAEVVRKSGVSISITNHICTENTSVVYLRLDVQYPTIFVYITLNHDVIKEYRLSQNGFMQLDTMAQFQLTYSNPGCVVPVVNAKNLRVQTVNRFMK